MCDPINILVSLILVASSPVRIVERFRKRRYMYIANLEHRIYSDMTPK